MIADRLRLNTVRVASVIVPETALSNSWWPAALKDDHDSLIDMKILCLWLNSTYGLIALVGAIVPTEGAWVELKKPNLGAIAVINPAALAANRRRRLAAAFDHYASLDMRPLPLVAEDDVRAAIDRAIAGALDLKDDFSVVRTIVAAEPILAYSRHDDRA